MAAIVAMIPSGRERWFARVERWTEGPMLALALIFLVVVILPEIMDMSDDWDDALELAVGWESGPCSLWNSE